MLASSGPSQDTGKALGQVVRPRLGGLPALAAPRFPPLSIDEELNVLDDNIRRLKIEYDVYFGGGSKKPPTDLEWRVQSVIKKYQDGRMNNSQRFRYNTMVNRYAIFNALWQKKLRIKEEGYRRPQDAILAIQGVREDPAHEQKEAKDRALYSVVCADPDADREKLKQLYTQLQEAMKKAGGASSAQTFDSFHAFIRKKTDQLRNDYGCNSVEYSLQHEEGKIRLKAKPR